MAKKNEVALFGAKTELPAYAANDAGLGNENLTSQDVGIPQIKLLQQMSPQLNSIEGAKAGLYLNTQTDELMEEVYFISLAFNRTFTVWKDQNLGGGKMGEFESMEAATDYKGTLPGGEGDYDVQETCAHFLLLLDPKSAQIIGPAVLYMDRSKLSAHRDLNALIVRNSPNNEPRFAGAYKFVAKSVTNKANKTFFVIDVENATGTTDPAWVSEEVYEAAKQSFAGLKNHLRAPNAEAA